MTTIDVILITYNQEQYIRQALDGIIMQKVDSGVSVRVIVADDCSTDMTLSIIRAAESRLPFPFVYLQSDSNMGMHKNYERAFKTCKSNYVAILEGDDYWISPNHLMNHLNFLQAHPECAMSMNNLLLLHESSHICELHRAMNSDYQYVDIRQQIAVGNQLGNLSACMFRGEYINTIPQKMYDLGFADWLLGMWMAQYGLIGILKQITSVYRLNANGQWTRLSEEQRKVEMKEMINKYDDLFANKYHSYFQEYSNQINPVQIKKPNIKKYLPPIIIKILKLLLPPALYKRTKKWIINHKY